MIIKGAPLFRIFCMGALTGVLYQLCYRTAFSEFKAYLNSNKKK